MKGTKRIRNHKATVYQTSHYLPEQIEKLKERAEGQERKIARFFFNHPDKLFGPCQVHKSFFPDAPAKQGWDLNSTRRAITNLTDDHILLKTDERRPTYRGGTENKWRWKRPEDFDQTPEQLDAFGRPEAQPKHRQGISL